MSMDLMVKAMKTKVGNPLRKLVLLKLADNANDLAECWPSHQHIADQCEISRRSVINHINALEKMGILTVESRVVDGEKKSNIYHLKLDGGSASPALPSASPALPSASPALLGSASPAHRISHSFESVNEPCANEASNATSVLDHLNQKSGRSYRNVPANLNLIRSRLKEGATVDDCKAVVNAKVAQWGDDKKMREFLRPATLFNRTNFEQYLGQLGNDVVDDLDSLESHFARAQ